MRVISVTPTVPSVKDELGAMEKEGIGDRPITGEVLGGCRSCICPNSASI